MKKRQNKQAYIDGILGGDLSILSQAITLIESAQKQDKELAHEVLDGIMQYTGNAVRLGITGAPGAGKSTFINTFGSHTLKKYNKLAVLAIDPSSSLTKGSIMGDKTRMGELSNLPNVFVRPSPTGTTLGGVARKTRETILLCEAAGYDFIIVETVGVGQSEAVVKKMVDFLLLLISPISGDELQGMKKGIVELADAIAITKRDGPNIKAADQSRKEYVAAMQLISLKDDRRVEVNTCSALKDQGIKDILLNVEDEMSIQQKSGELEKRRNNQLISWMYDEIKNEIIEDFMLKNMAVINRFEEKVRQRKISPQSAISEILKR